MTLLIIGLLMFFVPHLIPVLGLRGAVVGAIGENPYKGLVALLSLGGIVVIVFGMKQAEYVQWYQPQPWARHLLMTLMPLALILFAAANMPNNIRRLTRHPMMIGTLLWAGGHLLANGDQATTLLFGCFFVFALLDIVSGSLRGKVSRDPKLPFTADLKPIVGGLVVFALLFYFHGHLFGVALMPH